MKEIEVKYQLEDKNRFLKRLENIGCEVSEPKCQSDVIYVSNLKKVESRPGSIFLRVRKSENKIELNAKKHQKRKESRQEVEFEVSSYEKANEFLSLIGFQRWVEVKKKRRTTTYKGCHICIDEVERLGNFVELELVVEEDAKEKYILEKIESIAKDLEIDTLKVVNQHYDEMVAEWEKKDGKN